MLGTHKVIRTVCEVLEDVHGEPGTKIRPLTLEVLYDKIQEIESFYIKHRILPIHVPDDERI